MIDHSLLIGFGGPTKPEEVWPFIERLTRGMRIPEPRLKEVARHYEVTGGFSPYNQHAQRLCQKVTEALYAGGVTLPVFLGMRNWQPFLPDVIRQIKDRGLRHGLGIVLAPHRSEVSFGRYVASVEQAKQELSAPEIQVEYLMPWYDHPLFIEAQADRVREIWKEASAGRGGAVQLLFTAHSIPVEAAKNSSYEEEIHLSSWRVAEALGVKDWSVAYQSRSGSPGQPWLEPDLLTVIPQLKREGKDCLVVVPIGFLFDHTEVLYDLDMQAQEAAHREGLRFFRASTVMDHPKFVQMFAELIKEQVCVHGARR